MASTKKQYVDVITKEMKEEKINQLPVLLFERDKYILSGVITLCRDGILAPFV